MPKRIRYPPRQHKPRFAYVIIFLLLVVLFWVVLRISC